MKYVPCVSLTHMQWHQILLKQRAHKHIKAHLTYLPPNSPTNMIASYFLLTYTYTSMLLSYILIYTSLQVPIPLCVVLTSLSTHTHTCTHIYALLHQWSSQSLPLTSQQAVFHLPQIAPVCHPKLCLQSCLPTPLQHMAHLIGLRTPFWICKRASRIIIRNIQMKHRALIGISGGVEKDIVTFHEGKQWCWFCERRVMEKTTHNQNYL